MTVDELKFDERGLLPVVVQAAETGEVLMVAWMDRAAVESTLTSGLTHFWSRSRWRRASSSITSRNGMPRSPSNTSV